MGDNITDLPTETGLPPVPPKTYQWEDIRRQKLEGRYPWTHLYKPPYDEETYQKTRDHEYEPVIPMDNRKTPPPFVKVTTEVEHKSEHHQGEHVQDKHHLCIPKTDVDDDDENDYEDEDDDTEEITAAELQNRLEEKYFQQTPSPGSSKHDYELPETRSVSPAVTDDLSRDSSSMQDKLHSQTDKIKEKFKNLKDQISKDVDSSPRFKRKKDESGKTKPVKKNKFNFRKHNTKNAEKSEFNMPQAPRFSFSSLSSFSRSRSNSVKERERKRSQSSETDSQKKRFDFNFGTYPRIFKKKKTENTAKSETPNTPKFKPKSAPSSPSPRRSPFPQRWISKLTSDHKKEDEKKEEKKLEPKKQKIIQESIFISLHEDTTIPQQTVTDSINAPESQQQPAEGDVKPLSQKIDNKNFIFISLHEERFPEKLEKSQADEQVGSDAETESEIRKVQTARKFTNLLRRLETDRKLKSKRFADRNVADDKPEPVTITEIENYDESDHNNSTVHLEDSVETPEDTSEEAHLPRVESAKILQESRYTEVKVEESTKPFKEPKEIEVEEPFKPSNKSKEIDVEEPAKPSNESKEPTRNTETSEHTDTSEKSEPIVSNPKSILKASSEPKEPSKFIKIKEILIETEKIIKPNLSKSKEKGPKKFATLPREKESTNLPKESKEKDLKKFATQLKEKESKKLAEFKENILKETEKIGTLKNKIKNYFAKDSEPTNDKLDNDDKHIYEEFDNIETSASVDAEKRANEFETSVPQKTPRKKLKKLDSDIESKESLSAFEDPGLNDIITLDEQQPMTKTYINASLQEVNEVIEPEHTTMHFKNYEKALEKSRSYSSIEIENNQYSTSNTLARLETPVPPARPSRTRSLQRAKRARPIVEENKENCYEEQNLNYNTFPMIKPDKPRRKFRKHRTYSNSTNNTDVKSVNELEDAAISQNIANSKQLSVSFLPLTSNIVGEPLLNYNLRETSSMIHLNLNSDPPLPPKRRKSSAKDGAGKYNSLPNKKYCSKTSSKTSLNLSETCNGIHADTEDLEYADDANSIALFDSPPRRPNRKRSAGPSLMDEDRTSREIDSLPSEKSFCDSDSKDINGYAVIKPVQKSHSQPTTALSNTTPRRKSRRLSDFFTLPRIRPPTNYVSATPTFDNERRLPSPSRPPRKSRQYNEPVYTNEENINATMDTNFGDEEELNFNLAIGAEDDVEEAMEKDEKNLQTDEVMERMKIRPLPPPPRPTRKPKDYEKNEPHCDYSQVKKNTDNQTNNLNQESSEFKIININAPSELIIDRDTKLQDSIPTESSETPAHPDESELKTPPEVQPFPEPKCSSVIVNNTQFQDLPVAKPSTSSTLNVITAQKLNVSELNVAKLSISEIESSKITTSNLDSTTLQVSDIKTEAGHLVLNSVHLTSSIPERLSPVLQEPRSLENVDSNNTRDVTPSEEVLARSRISSMIPEVGSDEESPTTVTKVVRPSRRKSAKKDEPSTSSVVSEANQPTLAELMCQILQICHSSVGQAIHSLLEQIIPEDREKRNEVQAAIWVITIIVAGCLMLGLQSNEKIVHHHHWDFHFPPPH